jgi:two-component system sensor histidine kinase/response regulator
MNSTIDRNNKSTVLIVDDSPDTLTMLSGLLKDDYRIKIASKGEQALAIAASIPPPDLILLDIMMPEIDGYEVCTRLKADAQTKNIPVIFLTAKTDIADEQQGFSLGAVDYITKPISPPILLARVKTHINLKAAYDRLSRLLKFREDMVNMIVHDLRNPLSSVSLATELLLNKSNLPLEHQQKKLKSIQTSTQQLQNLVEDLLVKAQLESHALPLNYQPTELCALCETAIATLRESIAQKQINLITQYPPAPHRPVNVDAQLFRRAIENLISNAIKFSPSQSEVIVSVAYPDDAVAVVAIADQGPGVDLKLRERIFGKYEIGPMLEGVTQIGLGLAFCKVIVEAHGSTIGVVDNYPRGSIFRIELRQ